MAEHGNGPRAGGLDGLEFVHPYGDVLGRHTARAPWLTLREGARAAGALWSPGQPTGRRVPRETGTAGVRDAGQRSDDAVGAKGCGEE